MLFKELKLDPRLLEAIEKCGFTEPTDIQRKAIPVVLSGADLMASAQTGTGKTAAFVLPALQHLLRRSKKSGIGPRVLVLTPTRELAMQIAQNIRQFSRFSKISTGSIVGGMSYSPQLKMLRNRLDLLVATPGRLMDHMEQGKVDFSRLEILVLDEADRMLDMGFIDAVKDIAAAIPRDRQTLLFSATLEGRVLKIADQLLKRPQSIALVTNHDRHRSIRQHMHHADSKAHKHKLLAHHLENGQLTKTLIFTSTKRGADQLAKTLRSMDHKSAALHGDMSQNKRRQTVENLRKGRVEMLVATDVAARGLDIKDISHVINFDLPMVAEDYIHRIGRTGRAGATGCAISLVGSADWQKLSQIEKLTGRKINREVIEGLEPTSSEPKIEHGAKTNPKFKRKFGGISKGNGRQKPGHWRKGSSGAKRAKQPRVQKAA
ncbi:MAG TPA: ATP-dependent helicase [Gammaproteobacteria bacterium]|nr:ATP-dependent helicase [Gammaproteobacteria bacterium]